MSMGHKLLRFNGYTNFQRQSKEHFGNIRQKSQLDLYGFCLINIHRLTCPTLLHLLSMAFKLTARVCVCVCVFQLPSNPRPLHKLCSAALYYILSLQIKIQPPPPSLPSHLFIHTLHNLFLLSNPTTYLFLFHFSISTYIYISIFPSDLAFSVTKKRKKEQSRFHNLLLLVRTSLITLNFIHSYSYLMQLISVVLMKFFYSFIEVSSYCNQFHI